MDIPGCSRAGRDAPVARPSAQAAARRAARAAWWRRLDGSMVSRASWPRRPYLSDQPLPQPWVLRQSGAGWPIAHLPRGLLPRLKRPAFGRTKLLDAPVQIPLGAPLRNPFGAPLNLVDDLVAPFDRLLVPLRRSWTHPPNSGDCRDRPRSGRGGYRADSPSRARDRAPCRQARPGLVQYLSGSSSLPISSYGDAPGRVGAVPSRRIRP